MRSKFFLIPFSIFAVFVFARIAADLLVKYSADGKIYTNPMALPSKKVGLVLGCAPMLADGRVNLFFIYRVQAAAELYRLKKVEYLLVSGDNGKHDYDEPTLLKAALVALEVPAEKIFCDYAGFRTLDSLIRAKKVFCENDLIIISQKFHLERALFIAQQNDIEALGFAAPMPEANNFRTFWFSYVREKFARLVAVYDVVFATEPKFLGETITIE